MRFPSRLVLVPILVACACGGRIAPEVEELTFVPVTRSSGYGLVGGMHVTLVDPSTDAVKRTLRIDCKELQGTFGVGGQADVTLTEDGGAGKQRTFHGASGTVSIGPIGSGSGPLGHERVKIDILVGESGEPWVERHIAGEWDVSLDYEG